MNAPLTPSPGGSAEVLRPLEFPLQGSSLIEASAGTGKTFTIAMLYVRLVLGHRGTDNEARPLTPPEILVVTFTDAATKELRERIRARQTKTCCTTCAIPIRKSNGRPVRAACNSPPNGWTRPRSPRFTAGATGC
jgi:ATP-dependent exoDNAse (exonuclease V) beta subunit